MARDIPYKSDDKEYNERVAAVHPDLHPQFIFLHAAYNVRNTELGAVLGLSQLARLDENNEKRRKNFERFLEQLDSKRYFTDFRLEGSCNYAFNLILREPDDVLNERVMALFTELSVEFRRGSAGGGNQLRQPYLRPMFGEHYKNYPCAEHVHFYAYYIGNFPELEREKIDFLCKRLNEL